jgi:hypothetical protein
VGDNSKPSRAAADKEQLGGRFDGKVGEKWDLVKNFFNLPLLLDFSVNFFSFALLFVGSNDS